MQSFLILINDSILASTGERTISLPGKMAGVEKFFPLCAEPELHRLPQDPEEA